MAHRLDRAMRLPPGLRRRVEQLARRRRSSVEEVVHAAIEGCLRAQDREPPGSHDVIATLRAHADVLRRRGVKHLWAFASVTRGDAGPDRDIDLAIEVRPEARERFSLITLASIRGDVEGWLGRPVDVGERRTLRPSALAEFERDAVRVF